MLISQQLLKHRDCSEALQTNRGAMFHLLWVPLCLENWSSTQSSRKGFVCISFCKLVKKKIWLMILFYYQFRCYAKNVNFSSALGPSSLPLALHFSILLSYYLQNYLVYVSFISDSFWTIVQPNIWFRHQKYSRTNWWKRKPKS